MDGFNNRNSRFNVQLVLCSTRFWLVLVFGVCFSCLTSLSLAEEDAEADASNVDPVQVESTQSIEKEGILADENGGI